MGDRGRGYVPGLLALGEGMHRATLRGAAAALGILVAAPPIARAGDDARVQELERRLRDQDAVIRRLLEKVESLERRLDARSDAEQGPATTVRQPPPARDAPQTSADSPPMPPSPDPHASRARVDLSQDELPALPSADGDYDAGGEVAARPWYRNVDLFGFAAGGLVWTEEDGTDDKGSFLNYQGNLELRAQAWEDVYLHSELALAQIGHEDEPHVRVGELYVQLRDVTSVLFGWPSGVGMKVGRMDVPFGEDYRTRDVLDNPLITWSAAIPYAIDEGLLLYGTTAGVGWIATAMNGNLRRADDDDAEKFLSLKIFRDVTDSLYASASAYWNGDASVAAMGLGGNYWMPVGGWDYFSSAGVSASDKVDAYSYELDLRYDLPRASHVKAQFGQVFVDDANDAFSRTIYYGQLEPLWTMFDGRFYVAARASFVGTFDDEEGYVFEGRPFADGSDGFGYDTESLWRIALGAGYRPNDRMLLKLEWSRDRFALIDGSPLRGRNQARNLVGALLAVGF